MPDFSQFEQGASNTPDFSQFEAAHQASTLDSAPIDAITSLPKAIADTVMSIPSGVKNLAALPANLYGAGHDAVNAAREAIFGDVFKPFDKTPEEAAARYDQLKRTFGGVANIGAAVAGAGVAGPIAGPAATTLMMNKLEQGLGVAEPTAPESDAADLVKNVVQGGVISALAKGTGATASKLADAIEPETAEMRAIQSLGISAADAKAAAKYKGSVNGMTPLEQAVQGATERGVFTGDADPAAILARNRGAMSDLEDQLHGPNGILQQADAAQSNVNFPTFDRAQAVIDAHGFQAEPLTNQLNQRISTLNNLWDGSISDLSNMKSMMGKNAFTTLTDSKVLDRAIYADLRSAVESQAEAAVPGLGQKVADLNSDLSEHYSLNPIIQKAINRGTAAQFKAPEPSGPLEIAGAAAKGALQGGAGGAVASIAGVPHLALPAALAYAAIKGGGAALRNPTIGDAVSSVLDKTGGALSTAGSVLPGAVDVATNNQTPSNDLFSSLFGGSNMDTTTQAPDPVKEVEAKIDADPYLSALYQTESGRNPLAANPKSTAKGGFQFLDSTAKALGLKNPYDLGQSLEAVQKLTSANTKQFGDDPETLYAAHFMGAPLLAKVQKGAVLTPKEQTIVHSFYTSALPHFQKNYAAVAGDTADA